MPVGLTRPAGAGVVRPMIGFVVDERRRAVTPLMRTARATRRARLHRGNARRLRACPRVGDTASRGVEPPAHRLIMLWFLGFRAAVARAGMRLARTGCG
ncbi:hypothetical protein PJI17_24745 [Mycobacterium kansasii]